MLNIYNISSLLCMLDIEDSYDNASIMHNIMFSSKSFYREFKIPKRKGGFRTITSPYPTLHALQKKICHSLLNCLPIHPRVFAYVEGRSAIEHARYHCSCDELLTLDIKDFFPSISRQQVFSVFNSLDFSTTDSNYLSYLCTLNDSLPQGACTSPSLSNAVFYQIDCRLEKLALSFGVKYSRYADDLAFSGDLVPKKIINIIKSILLEYGFILNESKTKLKLKGSRKILTGVSISQGVMKAPKKYKRELRAQIFELEKNKDNLFSMPNFDPQVYEKTIGKLNYLLQIEPENEYAIKKRDVLLGNYRELISL